MELREHIMLFGNCIRTGLPVLVLLMGDGAVYDWIWCANLTSLERKVRSKVSDKDTSER